MSRIERSAVFLQFQNQKNHYKYILKPRSTFKINQKTTHMITSHFKTRTYSESQRNRKLLNQKILQQLQVINNKKGLLMTIQDMSQNYKKTTNTYNKYKTIQAERQINKANHMILKKLISIKPKIGQKQQWNKHYEQFKCYTKNLGRKNQFEKILESNQIIRLNMLNQNENDHSNLKKKSNQQLIKKQKKYLNSKRTKKSKRRPKSQMNIQIVSNERQNQKLIQTQRPLENIQIFNYHTIKE